MGPLALSHLHATQRMGVPYLQARATRNKISVTTRLGVENEDGSSTEDYDEARDFAQRPWLSGWTAKSARGCRGFLISGWCVLRLEVMRRAKFSDRTDEV
jgi:hypothetical protein